MRWNLRKRHHVKYRTWVSAGSPSGWNFSSLFQLCVVYSPNTYYFPGSRARASHWGTEVTGCPPALPSEDSLSSLGRAGQAGERAHQSEQPETTRESSKWGGRGEGSAGCLPQVPGRRDGRLAIWFQSWTRSGRSLRTRE